ncbi:cell division protein ZapD [Pseudaquabacterium rugosum]|uniref:Cell division protein ZapD n=1 Tax=Pseudaquabacterium rugosum TaxID=2984194 RepID=A0ABU9B6N1_9BURK
MVLYEYPFNESIRTMLRLEHLFDRLGRLLARESALDHHFALLTMFEITEVAARADLKSDLLKELERHKAQLVAWRDNPAVSQGALDGAIERIDHAFNGLNQQSGKAGHTLASNEWLNSLKSRIGIPGGTCEFDLPAYHAWQHRSLDRRRIDLHAWVSTLAPLAEALGVLLGLLRDSGVPHMVAATAGQFQQSLPQGRGYQMMRLRISGDDDLVPEITGHRLLVSVRLMRADGDGRLRTAPVDTAFELTLCA